jgi:hypothetical protein
VQQPPTTKNLAVSFFGCFCKASLALKEIIEPELAGFSTSALGY